MEMPDIDDVYAILRRWALAKQIHTYTELSVEYKARTEDWFEPHGSWDASSSRSNGRPPASLASWTSSATTCVRWALSMSQPSLQT
jgi:hypothetical protein